MMPLTCAVATAYSVLILGTNLTVDAARATLHRAHQLEQDTMTSFCCVAGEQDASTGYQWPPCPGWVIKRIRFDNEMPPCPETFHDTQPPTFRRADDRCKA